MDYNEEIENYEDDAEDRFDSYDEDDFDSGLGGMDEYYDEDDSYMGPQGEFGYDSYAKSSIGKIDPNDRTYTVVVTNTSGADQTATIFGANQNASQPAGVVVNITESSHQEVREESKSNPFKILGMKMSVSVQNQFDNVLNIVRRSSAGSNTSRVYQPRNATSPQNFNQLLIDDNNFEMDVTGQDQINFVIKDGVTVVFTFTIKARGNMGNLLKGKNVAELSQAPRTTGIPQLDLMTTQKQKAKMRAAAAPPARARRAAPAGRAMPVRRRPMLRRRQR